MAPASNTTAALLAENSQLQKQLTAAIEQASDLKDKLLACKDQLLAAKDENMGLRIKLLKYCCINGGDGAVDSQQCLTSSRSVQIAAPLDKDEVLDNVFGYVGGGDHLYVGGVSRRWRGRYMQFCAHHGNEERTKKFVTA
jgi:hypothetical protein